MADKEIKITFPEQRLEALTFFLAEKGETVEDVLKAHMDKTYDKNVPEPVKKFIESRNGVTEESTGQEQTRPQRQARESGRRNSRQSARQTAQEPAEQTASESEETQAATEEQEESPAMSMGM